MKILFVGEIIAQPGRQTVKQVLPKLLEENDIDLVLSNAENAAHGRGVTQDTLRELQNLGIDYFTGGDHVFWQRGTEEIIDELPILRPANYPEGTPGEGYKILDTGANGLVLVINLMGRTSFSGMNAFLDDPFKKADEILEETKDKEFTAKIIDFHAESSSEKYVLGSYLDGRVDIFVGSHTHVPSADGFVMPKGTLYISDVGMTGIIDSAIGVKTDIVLRQFQTARFQRFEWEEDGRKVFRSVLFDTEEKTIKRMDKLLEI
jgi:metallophosphoesterase (TIGR00282 family)